jgi:hypothetical protein
MPTWLTLVRNVGLTISLDFFSGYAGISSDSQVTLEFTALVNPGTRAQPLTRHLQKRTLVDVLLDHGHQAIPAAHTHPQRLFARTGLAVDCHRKARDFLLPDGLDFRLTCGGYLTFWA